MADAIRVEVVFATPERQVLADIELSPGATVAEAIAAADIARRFPGYDFDALEVGIWGRIVARGTRLNPGDRVEIYRPLELDPKEARRQRAMRRD